MGKIENATGRTASFVSTMGCFCVFLLTGCVFGVPPWGTASAQQASETLDKADFLGFLDCATRPDQLLAVRPEFYSGERFQARYVYPIVPGREANMLNVLHPAHWMAVVLYHRDGGHAALFEVGIDGPPSKRTFILLDGANLEKARESWVVKNILNGGGSTWPEIVNHVDRVSAGPLVSIPRDAVTRTKAACEFPKAGLTFVAVSASADNSNWKFKDGASEGVPFKSASGPFNNLDLKRGPSHQIYMITYGP